MKFVINNDKLKVEESKIINTGSIRDYLIPVETDESWNGLSIVAKICNEQQKTAIERAVIDDNIYVDVDKLQRYTIGFIGFTIEDGKKVYQKSTNLVIVPYRKGAGEINTIEHEDIPTASEWEIYVKQIEDMLNEYSGVPKGGTTGQALVKKSNADGDVEWYTIQGGGQVVPEIAGNTLIFSEESDVRVIGEELFL